MRNRTRHHGPALIHTINAEIDDLKPLGVAALRKAWTKRFRTKAPPIQSKDILLRLYAWRIQAAAFGEFDPETKQRLARLKAAHRKGKEIAAQPALRLSPGMVLTRQWQGTDHKVLVLETGFEYRGDRFNSLTHVARAITGTRWSGPRFFGLADEASTARRTEQATK